MSTQEAWQILTEKRGSEVSPFIISDYIEEKETSLPNEDMIVEDFDWFMSEVYS
jgi:hypothetical protein